MRLFGKARMPSLGEGDTTPAFLQALQTSEFWKELVIE